jgi:hypothetical protein
MRRGLLTAVVCLAVAGVLVAETVRADEREKNSVGPPVIVDSKGKTVGFFYYRSAFGPSVLREINGTWFLLSVSSSGFVSTGVELFYTTEDCTGTAYIAASDSFLTAPAPTLAAGIVNGVLYYAQPTSIKPRSSFILKSVKLLQPTGKPLPCSRIKRLTLPGSVGIAVTSDLSKLGFIPPFKLAAENHQHSSTGSASSKRAQ